MKLNEGIELYSFQEEAVEFAYRKRYSINAYDMGLGKSLIAIALAVKADCKQILVVCPAFLQPNWLSEIEKFCDTPGRFEVTSYAKVKATEEYFDHFDCVILDEAHYIKNMKAKRTKTLHKLIETHKPEYMLMLSGTPIKNRVPELFSLLKMVWYGKIYPTFNKYYGSIWDFQCKFTKKKIIPMGRMKITKFEGVKNIEELKALIKPIYLRRRAAEVLDLPEETFTDIIISDKCRNDSLLEEAWNRYDGKKDRTSFSAAKAVNALAKVPFTVEFVKNLLETAKSVVIFTDHVQAAKVIAHEFPIDEVRYVVGSTKIADRAKYVDEINEGKVKVLVATIGSLSVGVNLTGANYMVFNDFAWVEADMAQARKRIHRIGQDKKCFYYYIFSSKMDKHVQKKLREKQKLIMGLET